MAAGGETVRGSLPPRSPAPLRFAALARSRWLFALRRAGAGDIPLAQRIRATARVRSASRAGFKSRLSARRAGRKARRSLRSQHRHAGRPAAPQDRARREAAGSHRDCARRRLQVYGADQSRRVQTQLGKHRPRLEPTARAEQQEPPRSSIVVLPFANLNGDPGQEHFVDGVTESLTTDLSPGASFVIARTALAYKGKPIDAERSAASWTLRYVLEGSVRAAAVVNVQLIDAETARAIIFGQRFDKPLGDPFDTQDEIVARLANLIRAQVTATEAKRAKRARIPTRWTSTFRAGRCGTKKSRPRFTRSASIV